MINSICFYTEVQNRRSFSRAVFFMLHSNNFNGEPIAIAAIKRLLRRTLLCSVILFRMVT
jgi:hypothetical protein